MALDTLPPINLQLSLPFKNSHLPFPSSWEEGYPTSRRMALVVNLELARASGKVEHRAGFLLVLGTLWHYGLPDFWIGRFFWGGPEKKTMDLRL